MGDVEENVEHAWRAARAWNEGGVEAFLSYLDPEVIWHAPRESMEPVITAGMPACVTTSVA